jgi:hypothetical protein
MGWYCNDFSFYHTVVGQVFAIVMVFIFWNIWAGRIVKGRATTGKA